VALREAFLATVFFAMVFLVAAFLVAIFFVVAFFAAVFLIAAFLDDAFWLAGLASMAWFCGESAFVVFFGGGVVSNS